MVPADPSNTSPICQTSSPVSAKAAITSSSTSDAMDTNNPPEEVVIQLDRDPFYRVLTYIVVPLHFVSLIGAAWWAGTTCR